MDAYEVLNSSASASASAPASRVAGIACKEGFYVKHNGGYMIPTHSKIGQEMKIHFGLFQFVLRMILPIST